MENMTSTNSGTANDELPGLLQQLTNEQFEQVMRAMTLIFSGVPVDEAFRIAKGGVAA